MKHNLVMLSFMISSLGQPIDNINAYLSLLVEDLEMLSEKCADVFDGTHVTLFKL